MFHRCGLSSCLKTSNPTQDIRSICASITVPRAQKAEPLKYVLIVIASWIPVWPTAEQDKFRHVRLIVVFELLCFSVSQVQFAQDLENPKVLLHRDRTCCAWSPWGYLPPHRPGRRPCHLDGLVTRRTPVGILWPAAWPDWPCVTGHAGLEE